MEKARLFSQNGYNTVIKSKKDSFRIFRFLAGEGKVVGMNKQSLRLLVLCIGCFSFFALSGCVVEEVGGYGYKCNDNGVCQQGLECYEGRCVQYEQLRQAEGSGTEGNSCNSDGTCNFSDLICCRSNDAYNLKCVDPSLCNWNESDDNPSTGGDEDIVEESEEEVEEEADDTTTNKYNIEWVSISGGDFMMGPSPNDPRIDDEFIDITVRELPRHTVNVPSFELMRLEVTNTQYALFLGDNKTNSCLDEDCIDLDNPRIVHNETSNHWAANESYGNHPIRLVTWFGAKAFCEAAGGRLPSEAEWEYAARAETTTSYICGDEPDCLSDIACWNQAQTTDCCSVGLYDPNNFGLSDMLGNVSEWVEDCIDYKLDYNNYPSDGSARTSCSSNPERIHRGGSWDPPEHISLPETLLVSYRGKQFPNDPSIYIGFRCARDVE